MFFRPVGTCKKLYGTEVKAVRILLKRLNILIENFSLKCGEVYEKEYLFYST